MQFTELFDVEFIILGDVALAMLLGAFIGLEREFKDKPAGLRTHILVAGASALLVALGDVSSLPSFIVIWGNRLSRRTPPASWKQSLLV